MRDRAWFVRMLCPNCLCMFYGILAYTLLQKKVYITLMCLSIGTPKNNKFSICSKWKIHYFQCPKTYAKYNLIIMCLNIGTPKNIYFPFETNGKLTRLGVPILKHFRVRPYSSFCFFLRCTYLKFYMFFTKLNTLYVMI